MISATAGISTITTVWLERLLEPLVDAGAPTVASDGAEDMLGSVDVDACKGGAVNDDPLGGGLGEWYTLCRRGPMSPSQMSNGWDVSVFESL